jgi:hypothetical protein
MLHMLKHTSGAVLLPDLLRIDVVLVGGTALI